MKNYNGGLIMDRNQAKEFLSYSASICRRKGN